ncbi:hypothetical protein BX666DRAFT_1941469 [Dichotomocladium elegans]|nr:hypothetical protein BX666DRAFT_1941469 [Dichotomocladium elegans]
MKAEETYVLLALLILFYEAANAYIIAPTLRAKVPVFTEILPARKNQSSVFFYEGNPAYYGRNFSGLYEFTMSKDYFGFNEIPQKSPLASIEPAAIVYDNSSSAIFLFGELDNTPDFLAVYHFDLATGEWRLVLPPNETIINTPTWPASRYSCAIVYDSENNQAYISGGIGSGNRLYKDFWRIDFVQGNIVFNKLTDLPSTRVYHQMVFLSDGRILFIGGGVQSGNGLLPLSHIDVYDTHESKWVNVQPAHLGNRALPNTLASHSLSADYPRNRVFVTSGDTYPNDSKYHFGQMRIPMLVLDLTTWTWDFANTSGDVPERRYNALSHIMDPQYLVVAFGEGGIYDFDDINILNLETMHWIEGFDDETEGQSRARAWTRTRIIVATVLSVVLGILAFRTVYSCWKEKDVIKDKLRKSKWMFWDQREGEPLWAEISRISVMGITFVCFVILVVFIVKQVLDSPVVVQSYTLPVAGLEIPDIRICVDDVIERELENPVTYYSASGFSCGEHLYPLNLSSFRSIALHRNAVCYLFRPTENCTLSTDPLNPLGSKFEFVISINKTNVNATSPAPIGYISLYNRQNDPNMLVYDLPGAEEITMSDKEYDDWIIGEEHGDGRNNLYKLEFNAINNLQYSIGYRKNLNPTTWNLFGFFPERTRSPLLEATLSYPPSGIDTIDPLATSMFEAILWVSPHKFEIKVEEEVKVYTFLNALGTIGGIAGILFSLQVLLFGQRPQSPWGLIQRFSFGRVRQSLLECLRSRFRATDIPLIDPLGADISESSRITRMEQRVWMLERILAAYHINEDIFKGISEAVMAKQELRNGENNDGTKTDITRRSMI